MTDDIDLMLRRHGEEWRNALPGPRAARPTAPRRTWTAAILSLAACLAVVAVTLIVIDLRNPSVPGRPTGTGGAEPVEVVTNTQLIRLTHGQAGVEATLDRRLAIRNSGGAWPFVRIGNRRLGLVGPEYNLRLVAIDNRGHVSDLLDRAISGFALSADGTRIAWSEPHNGMGGLFTETTLIEARYPALDELARVNVTEFARVETYSSKVVFYDQGDGARGRGGWWAPESGAVAELGVSGRGASSFMAKGGNASGDLVVTEGDSTCASVGSFTGGPLGSSLTLRRQLDCRALTAVSPDGALIARVGPGGPGDRVSITIFNFSSGTNVSVRPIASSVLEIPRGVRGLVWTDAHHVTVTWGVQTRTTLMTCTVSGTCRRARLRRDPNRIALVAAPSTLIRRVGRPHLDRPTAITVDRTGRPVFCNIGTNQILRIAESGDLETIAGIGAQKFSGDGGYATEAGLTCSGLTVAADGTIYVADEQNNRVRAITPAGVITTFAGNGSPQTSGDGGLATQAGIPTPAAIAIAPDGEVWITNNDRVRIVAHDGTIRQWRGSGLSLVIDGTADLFSPRWIAFGPKGETFIYNEAPKMLVEYSTDGGVLAHWGGYLAGIATSPTGLLLADHGAFAVERLEGTQLTTIIPPNPAPELRSFRPSGVAIAGDGTIYASANEIVGAPHGVIVKVDSKGLHRVR